MKNRYLLFILTVLLVTIAPAQKLTITTSNGSKQYSAADITSSSPITFSNNGTRLDIGSNTYTVSDIVNALVTCENNGFVTTTCSECNGSTHCTTCHGTGKGCKTCNGTGKYCSVCNTTGKHAPCNGTGACPTCNGTGRWCKTCQGTGSCANCYYGECSKCEGTGNNTCSYCFGTGNCPFCGGAGYYINGTCSTCKGTGVCKQCHGAGTTGPCTKCGGNGKCNSCGGSRECSTCKGNPRCNSCNGSAKCTACSGSGNCTSCKGQPKCSTCGGDGHCGKCNNSDGKCTTCNGLGYTWTDIVLSNTSLTFSYLGENKYVSITINQSWKATCNASWITLYDAEGKNSGKITITADANPSEDSRTSIIVISHNGKTSYINVTQEGVPYLRLSKDKIDFAAKSSGNQTVTITSNRQWSASSNQEWLTVSPANGNGNGSLSITASDNPTMDQRMATVTLKYGDKTVTIDVTQAAGEGTISDAISNTIFAHDGEFQWLYIDASDRREWTVTRPADATWVHFETSTNTSQAYSGKGSVPIKIYVDRNPSIMGRSSSLTIVSGSYTHTIYITQEGGTMNLKDMLAKPFGVIDVDLTKASYNTVYNTLVNMFYLETYSDAFYASIDYNSSLTGMSYCGLKLWYFKAGIFSGETTYRHAFFIERSKVSDFSTYIKAILNEFSNLNIRGWSYYDYSNYDVYSKLYNNNLYEVYVLYDDPSFYIVYIDVKYR